MRKWIVIGWQQLDLLLFYEGSLLLIISLACSSNDIGIQEISIALIIQLHGAEHFGLLFIWIITDRTCLFGHYMLEVDVRVGCLLVRVAAMGIQSAGVLLRELLLALPSVISDHQTPRVLPPVDNLVQNGLVVVELVLGHSLRRDELLQVMVPLRTIHILIEEVQR